ncbi:hypothetical protein D9619_009988 [Psilocybe cf. subviscida]|uniref:Fe2OG dioxygenase domain-containing protein n=1 Tax=Psilocybe cf. subviscida TaxID=2480587 RepID=A0A8H5BKV4_9AGAR|nr:hypothetical protein D9619_009988 [Psilocybe cf. subviscida]
MPEIIAPSAPHYVPAPRTQIDLDYANLPIIDRERARTPEGRRALAHEARNAMTEHGFFYVINHGTTQAQIERLFDIADVPFAQVSDEEKPKYSEQGNNGSYQGYKLRQYWHIENGAKDQIEHYNVNRDVKKREHPEALRPFLPEIDAFARHNHEQVLHPILRLLAQGLELPEETLVDMHEYSAAGESSVRFMKYYPRSKEEELKTKNVWLKGHTDTGSITILYSQPVAALQILTKEGQWKWVKHIDNALVINAGDAIEFLSGGFYKATIHRVVQPPPDQQSYTRLGMFYFAMANDDVKLAPLMQSPVLQRVGVTRSAAGVDAPTMEAWRIGRTAAYGVTELKMADKEKGIEEEIISGIVVRHYN